MSVLPTFGVAEESEWRVRFLPPRKAGRVRPKGGGGVPYANE